MIVPFTSTVTQEAVGVYRWVHVWSPLMLGDMGVPVGFDYLHSAPRSITTSGNGGVGGQITYETSRDGSTFTPLTAIPIDDFLNSPLAGAAYGEGQHPAYVRPHVTGGDGSTSYVVTFVLRRPYR